MAVDERNETPGPESIFPSPDEIPERPARPFIAEAGEPGPGQLIAEITRDMSSLFRKEIELAKQEVSEVVKSKLIGAGFIVAAATLFLLLLPFIMLTIVFTLHIWLPLWASSLIVVGILLFSGAGAILVARSKLKGKFKPERTIRTVKEDIKWVKRLKS